MGKKLAPGRTRNGGYTDTPEGLEAYRRDQFERKEREIESAIRRERLIDERAAKVPEPSNAMSEEERNSYWGEHRNATVFLSKRLESFPDIRVKRVHGVLGEVQAQLVENDKVQMNFEVKVPFHFKSARREDVEKSVGVVRTRADEIWSVLRFKPKERR
jgi:hypothetical protein